MIKVIKKSVTPVYIEWVDSTLKLPVWHTDILKTTEIQSEKFITIGWLVNQNKMEYIIAGSLHMNEDEEIVSVGQVFTIPKGCVTKMTFKLDDK